MSKIFNYILVFSYLLFAPFNAAGSVLCIGDDGHVAIERAEVGSCCNEISSHDHEEKCGSCQDIALEEKTSVIANKAVLPPDALAFVNKFNPHSFGLHMPRLNDRDSFKKKKTSYLFKR